METKGEEISETTKRQNIEAGEELVEVVKTRRKKKQVKIKGPSFEVQQYEFLEVPKTSIDKFKSKSDLYDKYMDDREISLNEYSKLYPDVMKMLIKQVSLITDKDHAKNTLNLEVSTKKRIE